MPTKAEKRAYARKLLQIERRFGLLERDTLSRSIAMMRNFRGWIAAQLTEIDNFEQFRLRELQANIEQLILQYEGELRSLSNGAVRGSFNLGRLSVIEPLESAGITNLFFRPSPAQVNVLLDFSGDLIRGLGAGMLKDINTQISLAALGGKSPFQAMKDITTIIGLPAKASDPTKGISYQAERILRTELNRAYSLASFSQQRDLAEQVPDLKKQWRATGDARTRTSHLLAHGQIVLVNEPFLIGPDKAELMYPLDPAGPAAETINCRCRNITVIPEIGPIRSPLDDKIEAERARREKEKAVAKEKEVTKARTDKAGLIKAPAQVRKELIELGEKEEKQIRDITKQLDPLGNQIRNTSTEMRELVIRLQKEEFYTTWEQIDNHPDMMALMKKNEAQFQSQKELMKQRSALMMERDKRLRRLVYVNNPAEINVTFTSRFSASDPRRAAIVDGIDEFENLVSTDLLTQDTIRAKKGGRARSRYDMSGTMLLSTHARQDVIIHEMGHWLEDINDEIHQKALEFYDQRTEGDDIITMNKAVNSRGYRKDEITRPDEFISPYMGKIYMSPSKGRYATEIVSMGIEYMYEDPVKLATEDPDYFDFIFNILRGR